MWRISTSPGGGVGCEKETHAPIAATEIYPPRAATMDYGQTNGSEGGGGSNGRAYQGMHREKPAPLSCCRWSDPPINAETNTILAVRYGRELPGTGGPFGRSMQGQTNAMQPLRPRFRRAHQSRKEMHLLILTTIPPLPHRFHQCGSPRDGSADFQSSWFRAPVFRRG